MKISTKVEFGIIAIVDIAVHSKKGDAVTVFSISKRQNISGKYLEQILTALRQASLIRGLKGSNGGYVIARPHNEITLRDIINALDNTILSEVNFDKFDKNAPMIETIKENLWDKMTDYLQKFAKNITLEELSNEYIKKTDTNSEADFMYYI